MKVIGALCETSPDMTSTGGLPVPNAKAKCTVASCVVATVMVMIAAAVWAIPAAEMLSSCCQFGNKTVALPLAMLPVSVI